MKFFLSVLFLISFQISMAQPTLEYEDGKVLNQENIGISFNLKIKLFLDQRFDSASGVMHNFMWQKFPLKPKDLFGSQYVSNKFYPYNDDFELDSNLRSQEYISWVMVELRNADNLSNSFQVPLILFSNGYLKSSDNEDFGTINIRPGRYYVICTDVQSLGVVYSQPVIITSPNDYISIDFTKQGENMLWYRGNKKMQGILYPAHPYITPENPADTTWAAWMGDLPSPFGASSWDNLIDLSDWATIQNNYANYYVPIFDVYNDINGVVNLNDELYVISMYEKISGNPFTYH